MYVSLFSDMYIYHLYPYGDLGYNLKPQLQKSEILLYMDLTDRILIIYKSLSPYIKEWVLFQMNFVNSEIVAIYGQKKTKLFS